VKLGRNQLSDKTRNQLDCLDAVVSPYGDSMCIKDLSEIIDAVKAECGEDAEVSVHVDDYFGNHTDIVWFRSETDEEWEKRLEANKKRIKTAAAARKAAKKQKEIDERAELVRLRERYPEEG
ncbi:hypothetical protein LCGC14_1748310, partial [marine sediment metagenome]